MLCGKGEQGDVYATGIGIGSSRTMIGSRDVRGEEIEEDLKEGLSENPFVLDYIAI